MAVDVVPPDAEVKAACCTAFADAKCSDWNTMSCPSDKNFVSSNAAPADGSAGKTLTQAKYEEMCCVEPLKTCSDFSVAWAIAQGLGKGCALGDTKFFDLKKMAVDVVPPDAEVKAACCTPFADAKCSDWPFNSCSSGTSIVSSNAAPADGSDGKTLTQAKYREMCCVVPPKVCNDFSTAWLTAQAAGTGCALGGETKFFDLKTTFVDVAAPAGDAEVTAACCTAFADAKCSDWTLKSCSVGTTIVSSNAAPADGSAGKTLTQAQYDVSCCVEPLKTCSDSSVAWLKAGRNGGGCQVNDDTNFFDLKKMAVDVVAPAGVEDVRAACCTPFADAKCSDWIKVCPLGTSIVSSNAAPADGSAGKTLTQAKYEEMCCVVPQKTCSDFSLVWGGAQLLGVGGCHGASGGETKFFDLKKTAVNVAAFSGDGVAEVTAACCTPFADAKCSDWNLVMKSCPSGKFPQMAASAPADGSAGKTLTQAKYEETCCKEPTTCAASDETSSATRFSFAAWAVMLSSIRAVSS